MRLTASFYRRGSRAAVRVCLLAGLATATALSLGLEGATAANHSQPLAQQQQRQLIIVPNVNAMRGRRLFVLKGCVICHSVKDIGGKAAPALDAPEESTSVNLLDFAARMWRGAAAMQELQSLELGYRVELSGNEIGDLGAFASNLAAQKGFSINEVPKLLRDWFIDELYWGEGERPETHEWNFPK